MDRGFDESPVLEEATSAHAQAGLDSPGPVFICVRTSASTETEFNFFWVKYVLFFQDVLL